MSFDLLSTVTYGGCSAKISATELEDALKHLPPVKDERLLVDISTHDDAGVFQISSDIALIQTTDFFPPVCSDPTMFGRIAAANALSDIYAMGGTALTALNIVCFPSQKIPLSVLADILSGGQEKVAEAGAVIVGGHTIDDYPPKYGLAVTGTIDPHRIISNAKARPGDTLILTKPLGTGVIIAARRLEAVGDASYNAALTSMQQLNKAGAEIMQRYSLRCATDITGFSLLGHAVRMAQASNVTFHIDSTAVPLLPDAYDIADTGCIPGACFRNQSFVEPYMTFTSGLDYTLKMLFLDAQTSGGLLMSVPQNVDTGSIITALCDRGYGQAAVVGRVVSSEGTAVIVR